MKNNILSNFILFIFILGLIISSLIETDISLSNRANSYTDIKMREKDYVNKYCSGEIEYMLPDKTRIDCLTDEYAIEFDYAKKWAESIGQSMYYSEMTGKKPAVAIIMKRKLDERYIKRIRKANKNITIFRIRAY